MTEGRARLNRELGKKKKRDLILIFFFPKPAILSDYMYTED